MLVAVAFDPASGYRLGPWQAIGMALLVLGVFAFAYWRAGRK